MQIELVRKLINLGVIVENTEILAKCPIKSLGNMPFEASLVLRVERVIQEDDSIKLVAVNSGRKFLVPCSSIEEVDGMTPKRLASAFDLRVDGDKKDVGKKRGRKPKVRVPEEI